MSAAPSYHVTRIIFLRMMAAIYLAAFLSIYVQWTGLYSCSGVEPVYTHLQKVSQTHGRSGAVAALPTLAWLHDHEWIGLDIDVWMEALCMAGVAIAATTLLVGCDSALLYAAMLLLYSSIQAVGQNFMAFQWDILLLETGAIAVLLGAWARPTITPSLFAACDRRSSRECEAMRAQEERRAIDGGQQQRPSSLSSSISLLCPSWRFNAYSPALFLARFLLFRLMFASGVVKVLSECITWNTKLSAMSYHYATQCLPTPVAWFAHQLPASVQQLSTAGCIFIEVVGALLILTPTSIRALAFPRQLAYAAQAALQFAIMLTGNYTFFNVLTLALIATLVNDQEWRAMGRIMRPWLWCRSDEHRVQAAQSTAVAPEKRVSAVELTRVGNAANPSVASSSGSVMHAPSSSALAPTRASALRPSFLVRLVWPLASLSLKLSVLAALAWVFAQMYRVELVEPRSTHSTSGVWGAWSAAPSLRGLTLAEVPYAALLYLYPLGSLFRISSRFTPVDMQRWMDRGLSGVVGYATLLGAATLLWSVVCVLNRVKAAWVRQTARSARLQHGCARRFVARLWWLLGLLASMTKVIFVGAACAALFGASLVPFLHALSAPTLSALPYSRHLGELYSSLQPYHLTNSYGLFRSMTGVGADAQLPLTSGMLGATQSVSMVARPELVLEGSNDDGASWHEIPFRHKPSPSNVTRAPTWVAPHQPRLDWQMWFAALSPSSPPWLIHLVWRILEGQGEFVASPPVSSPAPGSPPLPEQRERHPVWDLLGEGGVFGPSNPPSQVRIRKTVLDFTRMDGCDQGRNAAAAAAAAKANRGQATLAGGPALTPLRRGRFSVPAAWWRDTAPHSLFLPPVDLDNPSLQNFLAQNHWVSVCARMRTDLIRKKAREQKEKIFEATPEKPTSARGAAAAAPAPQVRKNHIFTAKSPRPWHASFYLAWLELHLPSPATYGPHARTIKTVVQRSRAHIEHIWHNEWNWQTIAQSTLLQMIATSTLVVVLADLLMRA